MIHEIIKQFKGYAFLNYVIEDFKVLYYNIDILQNIGHFSEITEEQRTLLKVYIVPERLWNEKEKVDRVIDSKFVEIKSIFNNKFSTETLVKVKVSYTLIFDKFKDLDIIYKNILQSCNFIEKEFSDIDKNKPKQIEFKEKEYFIDMLRMSLSKQEQILLFYHAICFDNFKFYIEKFQLLRDLNKEDLIDSEHAKLYPEILLSNKYEHFRDITLDL